MTWACCTALPVAVFVVLDQHLRIISIIRGCIRPRRILFIPAQRTSLSYSSRRSRRCPPRSNKPWPPERLVSSLPPTFLVEPWSQQVEQRPQHLDLRDLLSPVFPFKTSSTSIVSEGSTSASTSIRFVFAPRLTAAPEAWRASVALRGRPLSTGAGVGAPSESSDLMTGLRPHLEGTAVRSGGSGSGQAGFRPLVVEAGRRGVSSACWAVSS